MTRIRHHSPRASRFSVIVLLIAVTFAGCVSDRPPPPKPRAVQEAEAVAAEARRHTERGNWPAAAAQWKQAADRYALLNDDIQEAAAWHNLAMAQKHLGDPQQALQSLQKASALNRIWASGDEWWRNQIAILQIRSILQQSEELKVLFDELTPRASLISKEETRGLFLNEWGLWQWKQGNLDEAYDTFDRALPPLKKAGSHFGQATVLANQAGVLESQNQFTEAVSMWRDALDHFEKLGEPLGIATALAGQGRSLLATGTSPYEAQELLRRAARNFQILNRPEEKAAIESLLDGQPALPLH